MYQETLHIKTRDDVALGATLYLGGQPPPKVVMVVGPDFGRCQEDYVAFAEYCSRRGFAVYTFDYRGTGVSNTKKKVRLCEWGQLDLDAILLAAKNTFPNGELIFVAHGFSAQLTGLAPASQYIDRLVFINGMLTRWRTLGYEGYYRFLGIQLRHLLSNVLPVISRPYPQLPRSVVAGWLRWGRGRNGLFDLYPDVNYRKLEAPLLSLFVPGDWQAPLKAVAKLIKHFPNAHLQEMTLPSDHWKTTPWRGDSFLEDGNAKLVWEVVVEWMGKAGDIFSHSLSSSAITPFPIR